MDREMIGNRTRGRSKIIQDEQCCLDKFSVSIEKYDKFSEVLQKIML